MPDPDREHADIPKRHGSIVSVIETIDHEVNLDLVENEKEKDRLKNIRVFLSILENLTTSMGNIGMNAVFLDALESCGALVSEETQVRFFDSLSIFLIDTQLITLHMMNAFIEIYAKSKKQSA